MYNLLVSADDEGWLGEPWIIERSRCVNEYTSVAIKTELSDLNAAQLDVIRRLPCIFAYEAFNKRDPLFGLIKDVTIRGGEVRIDYEIHEIENFISAEQLADLSFELELGKWELNRTHWAIKDVDLASELNRKGITLPVWAANTSPAINLTDHLFDVALSFPGEARTYVEEVAQHLERFLGPDRYFYDRNYTAQLARPSLDTFLQDIYRKRSRLIVVFACGDYQRKEWCGIEFRAIRDIINDRQNDRVMFVRLDDGEVDGIFGSDGYVDARQFKAGETAAFIFERVNLLA